MARHGLIAAACLLAAGCRSGNLKSCDFPDRAPQASCIEYQNASDDEITGDAKPACATQRGAWANHPCSRSNLVAGCSQHVTTPRSGAYERVTWYYNGGGGMRTALDVLGWCRDAGGTTLGP